MAYTQARSEKSDTTHYRKSGRSGTTSANHQPRNFTGKSTGTGAGPASSSSSNRFKKYNNAQGGQAWTAVANVSTKSSNASAPQHTPVQNSSHLQPPPSHGMASDEPVTGFAVKPSESSSTQKINQGVPKAPSTQSTTVSSDSASSTTHAKPMEDASRVFPLQFGSISPGLVNGMKIPARTTSAPPNLDEQKRDQARLEGSKTGPVISIPSASKQQLSRKDTGMTDQSNTTEAHLLPKAQNDGQVSSAPTLAQPEKTSVVPVGNVHVQIPFHQPHVRLQFGNAIPQTQPQGLVPTPLQMSGPITTPLQMRGLIPLNVSQIPHQLFMSNFQPHPMQHQGQNFSFTAQMGPPPQFGDMGVSISPQFPQHMAVNLGGSRTPVKITDPKTQMDVKLNLSANTCVEGGSTGTKSHFNVPQLQPAPLFTPAHPMNYYPNIYEANSRFYTPPNSHPLTGTQVPHSSQAARVDYSISQGPQATPFVNPSTHGLIPSSLSAKMQVSVKPAASSMEKKVADSSLPATSSTIGKVDSSMLSDKQHDGAFTSVSVDGEASNTSDSPSLDLEGTTSVMTISDAQKSETVIGSSSKKEHPKKTEMKEDSQSLTQEGLKKGNLEAREKEIYKLPEVPVNCDSLISCESIVEKSAVVDTYTKLNSTRDGVKLGVTEKDESCQKVVEKVSGNVMLSKSSESINFGSSQFSDVSHRLSHGDNASIEASSNTSNGSKEIFVAKSDEEVTPHLLPPHPEGTLNNEGEFVDNNVGDLVSLQVLDTIKEKPAVEPSRKKIALSRSKKKIKVVLQKADAAGTTSDLYMAYKGPGEKKDALFSSENTSMTIDLENPCTDNIQIADIANEKGMQDKLEADDWEDNADISTPKLDTLGNGEFGNINGSEMVIKIYSRDFLLKFVDQCNDLPDGFEITSEIAALINSATGNISHPTGRNLHPSLERNIDRSTGASRQDRRGNVVVGLRPGQGGNFGVLKIPHAGGILSGPMKSMGSQGGLLRNNSDADRWQRATGFQKSLIPSPHTPLQAMHRAEKKYEIGKVSDKEQAKQRQLKAILNKLTPQNFEKLFEQVKAVNIDNAITLTGVISQIFDKALTEPTFCEMYADFCHHLAGELPDFSEDNEKITFKRLLLNKCQEEFERGEREQEEANRDEEGGIKQSKEEREEKRVQVRRRMLGNIRLIGELYKKKMLTERIMHSCINKLLGQNQNPDEEDIEALCKLMSTIGEMIDHPKAKEHMNVYFDIMKNLSNNLDLSSRVRFMLKDSIDLRRNKWQQRRKVDGPKKIDEVHRDAAQERHAQSQVGRNSSVRRDFGYRGSTMLPSPNIQMGNFRRFPPQVHGYGNQDVRTEQRPSYEAKPLLSIPLLHRPGENSVTLGPQGGLARGMSNRGLPSGQEKLISPSACDPSLGQEPNMLYGNRNLRILERRVDSELVTSSPVEVQGPAFTQSENVWPEEQLRKMSISAIREFYSAKSESELVMCIKTMNSQCYHSTMISLWVTDSFERKDMDRDLLSKLLVSLYNNYQSSILTEDQLVEGFESVLTSLEDAVNDAPKAAEFLGRILAEVIMEDMVPLEDIGKLIYTGGEEPGRLVELGLAADVLGSILEIIQAEKGEEGLNEIRSSSNLRCMDFRPPRPLISRKLEKFI